MGGLEHSVSIYFRCSFCEPINALHYEGIVFSPLATLAGAYTGHQ